MLIPFMNIKQFLKTISSLEATKCAILPELVELTNDEESSVRLAGLETVVNVLGLLDDGRKFLLSFLIFKAWS